MTWKTSCNDVATRVGRFALHIIFAWTLIGAEAVAPLPPPQMTPLPERVT